MPSLHREGFWTGRLLGSGASHERLLAGELALGEAAGPALCLGDPPEPVQVGLALAASRIRAVALDPVTAWSAGNHLLPLEVEVSGELDPYAGPFGILCAWELPRTGGPELLEAALGRLADGAAVWVSLARDRSRDGRLERLLAAHCGGRLHTPLHAPSGRFVRSGVRSAPRGEAPPAEPGERLPVEVVVVREAGQDAETLLCDVLLRQRHPPSRLLVLDLVLEGPEALPRDLYGLPGRAGVPVGLVSRGPGPVGAAFNEALEGVEAPFTVLLRPGERVAPNHLAALGLALEARPACAAVAGAAVGLGPGGMTDLWWPPELDPEALVLPLAHGLLPLRAATLIRTQALRDAGGLEPGGEEVLDVDLFLRLALHGSVAVLQAPVAGLEPESAARYRDRNRRRAAARRAAACVASLPTSRLARQLPDVPGDQREGLALLERGRALVRLRRLAEARADLEAAAHAGAPPQDVAEALHLADLLEGREQGL